MNVKVSNLISRTNCQCKCRLDASVCHNKRRWNEGKCRFECRKLFYKGICHKGFVWNPSNCKFEYD